MKDCAGPDIRFAGLPRKAQQSEGSKRRQATEKEESKI